jgi:RNA polymerase sigma factor (sigma-70 family)
MVVSVHTDKSHKIRTDEELVRLFIHTQQNAFFEELYERYADKVYRKCFSLIKDPAQAEDFTHDIFIKLIFKLGAYKEDARFSTWLYSITYNHCMDQLRITKRRREVPSQESAEVPDDTDQTMMFEEYDLEGQRLRQALAHLHPDEQEVLMMKYKDELSIREMADVFQISESAVKMRLLRSRDKLRTHYMEKILFWGLVAIKSFVLLKFVK